MSALRTWETLSRRSRRQAGRTFRMSPMRSPVLEHGADLRREQPGHLFERLAEPQSLFEVGCQQMEADPQRAVAAGGGAGDSGFRRAAFLQAEFQQVQEHPGPLVAAQGQREQEVDEVARLPQTGSRPRSR